MLSPAVAALLAAVQTENAARVREIRPAPDPVNASRSDAARSATWPCHGPACNREFTRPSRSHDGRSCERCRRSKAESDAFRARLPLYTPLHARRIILSA